MAKDTSAMREFRLLDAKRCTARLTTAEEARWRELRDQLRAATAAPEAHIGRPAAFGKPIADLEWAAWTRLPPVSDSPAGFDFEAQAHWAADGTWFPPGLDPVTRRWIDPAYVDAWRQGFIWDRATQGWAALPEVEMAAPEPEPAADEAALEETAPLEAAAAVEPPAAVEASDAGIDAEATAQASAPEVIEASADWATPSEAPPVVSGQTGSWGEFVPEAPSKAPDAAAPAWEYAQKTPARGWVVREPQREAAEVPPAAAEAEPESAPAAALDSDLVEELLPSRDGSGASAESVGVDGHGAEDWQIVHGPAHAEAPFVPIPTPSFASRSGEWSVDEPVPLPGPTSDMIAAAIPAADLSLESAQAIEPIAIERSPADLSADEGAPEWNEPTDELPAAGLGETGVPEETAAVEAEPGSGFDWQSEAIAEPESAPAELEAPAEPIPQLAEADGADWGAAVEPLSESADPGDAGPGVSPEPEDWVEAAQESGAASADGAAADLADPGEPLIDVAADAPGELAEPVLEQAEWVEAMPAGAPMASAAEAPSSSWFEAEPGSAEAPPEPSVELVTESIDVAATPAEPSAGDELLEPIALPADLEELAAEDEVEPVGEAAAESLEAVAEELVEPVEESAQASAEPQDDELLEPLDVPPEQGAPEVVGDDCIEPLELAADEVLDAPAGDSDASVEPPASNWRELQPAAEAETLELAEGSAAEWSLGGPTCDERGECEPGAYDGLAAEPETLETVSTDWLADPESARAAEAGSPAGDPSTSEELQAVPLPASESAGTDAGELVEYVELPGPDEAQADEVPIAVDASVPVPADDSPQDPFATAPEAAADSLLSMDWSVLPGTERVADQSGNDLLPIEPAAVPELEWEPRAAEGATESAAEVPLAGASKFVAWAPMAPAAGDEPFLAMAQAEPASQPDAEAVAVGWAPLPDEPVESVGLAAGGAAPEIELAAAAVEAAALPDLGTPEGWPAQAAEPARVDRAPPAVAIPLEFEVEGFEFGELAAPESVAETPMLELELEDVVQEAEPVAGAEPHEALAPSEPEALAPTPAELTPLEIAVDGFDPSGPTPNMPTIDLISAHVGEPTEAAGALPTSIDIPIENFESGEVPAFDSAAVAPSVAEAEPPVAAEVAPEPVADEPAAEPVGALPQDWSAALGPVEPAAEVEVGNSVAWELPPPADAADSSVTLEGGALSESRPAPSEMLAEPQAIPVASSWELPADPALVPASATGAPRASSAVIPLAARWEPPLESAPEGTPAAAEPELMEIDDADIVAVEASSAPAPQPEAAPAPEVVAEPPASPARATVAWPPTVAPRLAVPVAATPAPAAIPNWLKEAQAPAVAASAAPTSARVDGERRVIVHTLEGSVVRGVLRDADLLAPTLSLETVPSGALEHIATDRLKAVFVLAAPGAHPLPGEGRKLRITFHDERQLAGFAADYSPDVPGFFVTPAESRSLAERVFVYQAGVKTIAPG